MFDGLELARRVFPTRTDTARSGRPATIIRYTGHPPVLQQIAGQVRSSSGMTYGRATHDGARMHPGFTRSTTSRDPVKG